MIKIHVITGWNLPTDEMIETVLIDQLTKKLQEEYDDLNVDEIEFAFRQSGTTIKDWGKSMNLSMVDKVLRPYLHQRFEASRVEERLAPPQQTNYTPEQLDNFHRRYVEEFYQRCLRGITPPNDLPDFYKAIMVKDGIMEEADNIHEVFAHMINNQRKNIYIKQEA